MKKLIYLIVLIAVLGLIVSGCIPVVPSTEQNESGTLPNKALGDVWNVPGGYATIQLAINAATGGEIINVAAGPYAGFTDDKGLDIRGAQYNEDPAGNLSRGDETVITSTVTLTADNASVNGFKMTSSYICAGYPSAKNVNISYNILENVVATWGAIHLHGGTEECNGAYVGYNTISGAKGHGIWTVGNDNVTIEHNYVLNAAGNAIECLNHVGTGIIIRNNVISNPTGKGINYWGEAGAVIRENSISESTYEAIFTDRQATIRGNQISGGGGYGILVANGADNTIVSGNTISNPSFEGIQSDVPVTITYNDISGGSTGIQLSNTASGSVIYGNNIHDNDYWGLAIQGLVNTVTVRNNQFTNNPYCGVVVWEDGDGSGIHINYNEITGNGIYGVESKRTTSDVDATYNWWGHPGGPRRPAGNSDKISGPKTADQVSENVLYHPWLSGAHSVSNIALNQAAIASATYQSNTATLAVDGDYNTLWNSGNYAPQWIEIDLGKGSTVVGLRLLTAQLPVGDTTHVVLFSNDGDVIAERTFSGYTETEQWLEAWFEAPFNGVKTLRVTTTASPSWVAWYEIEVYGWQ